MTATATVLATAAFMLLALARENNPYLSTLGIVLAYAALFITLIYAMAFAWYERVMSGDDEK